MSKQTVFVATSKPIKRFIGKNKRRTTVTLCVGTDGFGQFGVGYFYERRGKMFGSLWGLSGPGRLIQAWRAMKLLQEMPRIESNTLCLCWYAANQRSQENSDNYIKKFGSQYGDYEKSRELRAEVLAMFPTAEELNQMLTTANTNNVEIRLEEIEENRPSRVILEHLRLSDEVRAARAAVQQQPFSLILLFFRRFVRIR